LRANQGMRWDWEGRAACVRDEADRCRWGYRCMGLEGSKRGRRQAGEGKRPKDLPMEGWATLLGRLLLQGLPAIAVFGILFHNWNRRAWQKIAFSLPAVEKPYAMSIFGDYSFCSLTKCHGVQPREPTEHCQCHVLTLSSLLVRVCYCSYRPSC
jgi:hypothetical protein